MEKKLKTYLICLGIPLAVGALSTALSGGMQLYGELMKPPLSPPGWLFPIVWTTLYLLMGWASYRVHTSGDDPGKIRRALILYGAQLLLNFAWSIVFFRFRLLTLALAVLISLWVLILLTMRAFARIDKKAGDLLIPYLLWVTFAGYLNYGFILYN